MVNNTPLSLYVHFPWCVRKCPYCDFNSHETNTLPEDEYVSALLQDMDENRTDRPISTVFLGGGTPSLFSGNALKRFFKETTKIVSFTDDAEITLEANPGTTDYQKFSGYHEAGINRLSIGVQSFSNKHLSTLGRIHSSNEVTEAFDAARAAGFENINLDLMHGLPDQSVSDAMHDLERAIELDPEHISWYQLTIEPNTLFNKYPPTLPNDDKLWEIYETGLEKLAEAGYQRYEVSAFARPGKRSAHNLNYWRFGDYIGIGAGAHGKLTSSNGTLRTAKTRLPKDYLAQQKQTVKKVLEEDLDLEFLMNTLRLSDGFELDLYSERTGRPISQLEPFFEKARARQLLELTGKSAKPTRKGLQFLNELLLLVD